MKKVLIIALLFVSCTKKNIDEDMNNISNQKIFIQVEATYKDGNTDLSPIVSINL